MTRLYSIDGGLAVESPYHPPFVEALKQEIPYHERRWDNSHKRWIVAPQHGQVVSELIQRILGETIELPQAQIQPSGPQIRIITLEYLGRCKQRGDGEATASGWANGGWTMLFPESVLRARFAAPETDDATEPATLYTVLGVQQTAAYEEIKKAYRRLALHTHPDQNKEPDAAEQFQRIKHAYDVLSNAQTRKKYDVGLKLEASLQHNRPKNVERQRHDADVYGYRAPLRCGWLVVEGVPRIGQFVVSRILKWKDIVRDDGKTMVSSWPQGKDHFEIHWFDGGTYV